jgi:hypothetical protein
MPAKKVNGMKAPAGKRLIKPNFQPKMAVQIESSLQEPPPALPVRK